jgi:Na+/H+-dicarboxylate symporter
MTLKLCAEKLGVDSRLAMFSIPVGLQFNMNGSSFYTAMIAVLMARSLGVGLNLHTLVTLTVSTFLVSVTMAGCPGSAIIGLSTVFEAVGIPTAAVALFLPIDSPVGMFRTVGNVTSDVASTMMLACSEKQVDKETYTAE